MSTATHPATIHPTAVVSPKAKIGYDCFIGPYCIVGDEVVLGDNVRLESHCVIDGRTSIGADTHVFPFVSIGLASQASDEAYLEQWSFIDRIVYADGSMRKLIRGSGKIDDVSGIDSPIVKDQADAEGDDAKRKGGSKRGQTGKRIHS